MTEPIAIIIPTKDRLKNMKRCLANLEQVNYPKIEIVVICDGDEKAFKALYGWVGVVTNAVYKCYLTNHQELVKATRYGIEHCDSEFIVYYNDDMMMDKDCLSIAMREWEERFNGGEGLIGFDDGINKFIGAVGLTNKKTIKKFDAWNPIYIHFWADTELGVRTRNAGCFYWSHDAKIDHLHPLVNKASWDRTYENSHKHLPIDTIHFIARNGVWTHRSREQLEHEA